MLIYTWKCCICHFSCHNLLIGFNILWNLHLVYTFACLIYFTLQLSFKIQRYIFPFATHILILLSPSFCESSGAYSDSFTYILVLIFMLVYTPVADGRKISGRTTNVQYNLKNKYFPKGISFPVLCFVLLNLRLKLVLTYWLFWRIIQIKGSGTKDLFNL